MRPNRLAIPASIQPRRLLSFVEAGESPRRFPAGGRLSDPGDQRQDFEPTSDTPIKCFQSASEVERTRATARIAQQNESAKIVRCFTHVLQGKICPSHR